MEGRDKFGRFIKGMKKSSTANSFVKGHIQSPKCKDTWFKKGKQHPLWKGGKRKKPDRKGYYILALQPKHPFADSMGYVLEHRLVMEKKLGRFLKRTERVHHINGNKHDNHLSNLMYFPNERAHQKFHHMLKQN